MSFLERYDASISLRDKTVSLEIDDHLTQNPLGTMDTKYFIFLGEDVNLPPKSETLASVKSNQSCVKKVLKLSELCTIMVAKGLVDVGPDQFKVLN